ncbi:ER membrane protein complex subunit 5 [Protopterus annectens]|uniref:ER membrane protein complex subunit 5 n=1 Tax=Protopterus annectens TaxID=7888 RepID=UPI001CF9E170|nr:ER membrane protein complex subunit 5 [Protopterus annectens]
MRQCVRLVLEVKMASSFWKGVVGIGLFALAHAAFSAAQHYFPSEGGEWKKKCNRLRSNCFQEQRFIWLFYVYNRSYMRLTEKENETLPIDIVLQTLFAFLITCYGIVHVAGDFKDMDATSELQNKYVALRTEVLLYV